MDDEIKASLEQTRSGAAAIGVAIVQVLAESDPTLPGRIRDSAESWYRIFEDRGEDGACEVLLIFGRALADKELFPSTDS